MHIVQDLERYNRVVERNTQTENAIMSSEDHFGSLNNAGNWLEDGIGEEDEAMG